MHLDVMSETKWSLRSAIYARTWVSKDFIESKGALRALAAAALLPSDSVQCPGGQPLSNEDRWDVNMVLELSSEDKRIVMSL